MNDIEGIIYQTINLIGNSILLCLITPRGKIELVLKGGQSNKNRYRGLCQYLNKVSVTYDIRNKTLICKTVKFLDNPRYLINSYQIAKTVSQIIKLASSITDIDYLNFYNLLCKTIYIPQLENRHIVIFYIKLSKLLGGDILLYANDKPELLKQITSLDANSSITQLEELQNSINSYYNDYLGIKLDCY